MAARRLLTLPSGLADVPRGGRIRNGSAAALHAEDLCRRSNSVGNGALRRSTKSRLLQTAMLLDPKRTSCRKSAVSDVLVCAVLALGRVWGGETSS